MSLFTDLVVDAIEQTRHNRKEGGFESFNVIHEQRNVALVETYSGPVAEHRDLWQRWTLIWGLRTDKHEEGLRRGPATWIILSNMWASGRYEIDTSSCRITNEPWEETRDEMSKAQGRDKSSGGGIRWSLAGNQTCCMAFSAAVR